MKVDMKEFLESLRDENVRKVLEEQREVYARSCVPNTDQGKDRLYRTRSLQKLFVDLLIANIDGAPCPIDPLSQKFIADFGEHTLYAAIESMKYAKTHDVYLPYTSVFVLWNRLAFFFMFIVDRDCLSPSTIDAQSIMDEIAVHYDTRTHEEIEQTLCDNGYSDIQKNDVHWHWRWSAKKFNRARSTRPQSRT